MNQWVHFGLRRMNAVRLLPEVLIGGRLEAKEWTKPVPTMWLGVCVWDYTWNPKHFMLNKGFPADRRQTNSPVSSHSPESLNRLCFMEKNSNFVFLFFLREKIFFCNSHISERSFIKSGINKIKGHIYFYIFVVRGHSHLVKKMNMLYFLENIKYF